MNGNSTTLKDLEIPVEAEKPGECRWCGQTIPPGLCECQDVEACKGMELEKDENFPF